MALVDIFAALVAVYAVTFISKATIRMIKDEKALIKRLIEENNLHNNNE